MVGIFLPSSKYGKVQLVTKNSPFVVTGGNEAGFDLVLIKPFLLCYVNHVVLMLNSIFLSKIYIRKGRRFVSNKVNLTFTQRAHNCKMAHQPGIEANEKYFE